MPIRKSPGSIRCFPLSSMIDICSPVSTNETFCFSPGLRKTRLTPASDLIGTGTVAATSVTYNWTTSSPAFSPTFRTSAVIFSSSPALTLLALSFKLSYLNFV